MNMRTEEKHSRARAKQKSKAEEPKNQSKRDVSWHDSLVYYLARGVSVSGACRIVGISRATYYRHLKADPDFEMRVERMLGLLEMELLNVVKEAGDDWRSAAWLLEKRYPTRWGTGPRPFSD